MLSVSKRVGTAKWGVVKCARRGGEKVGRLSFCSKPKTGIAPVNDLETSLNFLQSVFSR